MRSPDTISKFRPRPVALQHRAAANLRYIRETMETARAFTAVPGWGGVAIGAAALVATTVAGQMETFQAWMVVWLVCAAFGLTIGTLSMIHKARGHGMRVDRGPGRGFVLSLTPPMVAGIALTVVQLRAGLTQTIPGTWLLLYGTGVVTGGAFSVRPVPVMGLGFMALGCVALALPFDVARWVMGFGFGGLHLVFGAWIARRYGGGWGRATSPPGRAPARTPSTPARRVRCRGFPAIATTPEHLSIDWCTSACGWACCRRWPSTNV